MKCNFVVNEFFMQEGEAARSAEHETTAQQLEYVPLVLLLRWAQVSCANAKNGWQMYDIYEVGHMFDHGLFAGQAAEGPNPVNRTGSLGGEAPCEVQNSKASSTALLNANVDAALNLNGW